jgi:hypothetical protein
MQNLLFLSFDARMGLILLLFWTKGRWNVLLICGMIRIFTVVLDTFDTSRCLFGLEICKGLLF